MTNPAKMLDALRLVIENAKVDLPDCLIFLPSRRSVRAAEKMFAETHGGAVILPKLVALGEGVDDDTQDEMTGDVFSNLERVTVLVKLLAADSNIHNISTALPIARDFVRMQDYMENEGINSAEINWEDIIESREYAQHFKSKAKLLNILTNVLPNLADKSSI